MKFKEIFKDQSFWSLLIINVAIIVYYLCYNTGFKTLVWIYWAQSVLIGVFTFLQLATVRTLKSGSITFNNTAEATIRRAAVAFRHSLLCIMGFFIWVISFSFSR